MNPTETLIMKMIAYYAGDPKRIQHFVKVYEFASLIGKTERLKERTQFILETAAVVHDIGIKVAEEKYGSCIGKYQEQEGPAVAQQMLTELGYEQEVIERVCYLVGHHHTYANIDGMDYQILVEADFLVNLYEDGVSDGAAQNAFDKIFVTQTGRQICAAMFL